MTDNMPAPDSSYMCRLVYQLVNSTTQMILSFIIKKSISKSSEYATINYYKGDDIPKQFSLGTKIHISFEKVV